MDEEGDVGPARNGISEVGVNVVGADETLIESLPSGGYVHEQSYDEMFGEDEIIVEVVGSDVFVDGVQQEEAFGEEAFGEEAFGEEALDVDASNTNDNSISMHHREGSSLEDNHAEKEAKSINIKSSKSGCEVMEVDASKHNYDEINIYCHSGLEGTVADGDSIGVLVSGHTDAKAPKEDVYKRNGSVEAIEGDHQSVVSSHSIAKPGSSFKLHQSGYLLSPSEGHFAAADLVWGKVRSHPWWPGRICDPADASEKVVKYFKKDCYLVAYYGDGTFAWNDASVLKPFRSHFSQMEIQSNLETFQSAVCCALEEVHRRVELGLTCSCIPKDVYDNLEYEILENAGIREESSKQYINDKSCSASSFEQDEFVDYIRSVALSPTSRVDGLDLSITQAQLSAYCRFKGYSSPPEFVSAVELLENNADLLNKEIDYKHKEATSRKRKHGLSDSSQPPTKKERKLSMIMDMTCSPDDDDEESGGKPQNKPTGRKRKPADSLADISNKKINISAAIASATTPKPSFKIGERIRRVASQLTGSASVKSSCDQPENDASPQMSDSRKRGNIVVPLELSSIDLMLLQLKSAAQNPRGQSLLNNTVSFFSSFRKSVFSGKRSTTIGGRTAGSRKRKRSQATGGTVEEFEFDDINDSYWTDRIVQNYTADKLLTNGASEEDSGQPIAYDPEKPVKSSRRPRKRYSSSSCGKEGEELSESDKKKRDMSQAELIMNFSVGSLPSEIHLNKVFRRFGTLKEAETEIDYGARRARVVFKRGSDAEIAYNSSTIFSIFGSAQVTYQLSYSTSSSGYKPLLPLDLDQNLVDAYKPSPPATDQYLLEADRSSPPATYPISPEEHIHHETDPNSAISYNPSYVTDPNLMEPFDLSHLSHATSHKPSPPVTDPNLMDVDIPPPAAEPNSVQAT